MAGVYWPIHFELWLCLLVEKSFSREQKEGEKETEIEGTGKRWRMEGKDEKGKRIFARQVRVVVRSCYLQSRC